MKTILFFSILITVLFSINACKPIQENEHNFVQKQLAALEKSADGRIGVSLINTAKDSRIDYRAEERFPFCSTFKVMVVAAILKESMIKPHLLKEKLMITQKEVDSSGYAPITKKQIGKSITVFDLCAAALLSDNVATNLLIQKLGGNKAIVNFAHSIGDDTFRLDRSEPELNSSIPGDLRDTTSPAAMSKSLQKIVLGDVLGVSQRQQLQVWLKANTTGDHRIRAAVPKNWIVGDKTGTSDDYGTTNDIGVIWPLHCSPIVLSIYFTQNKKDAKPRDDVLASATRIVMKEFEKSTRC